MSAALTSHLGEKPRVEKSTKAQIPPIYPLVSVVIPSRNSSSTIEKCLKSILNQTYTLLGKLEMIVIDNYSTDDTRKIATKLGAQVHLAGPERTAHANYGARLASGEYLYRVDSDWIFDSDLIEEAVRTSELFDYDAIAIHNTSDPTVSFWSRVRKFERDFYSEDPLALTPDFFKTQVYLQIGGLDESLVACEDYEIHRRLLKNGFRIGR